MCPQHDMTIDNASGASVRSDLNNALAALVGLSSGASAPSTTFADMLWVDTTNGVIKRRNSANSGWLPLAPRSSTIVQAKTTSYTVAPSDFATMIDCTSGTFTLSLTAVATVGDGFFFFLRNSGTGTITVDPSSSETVDGVTTLTVSPGDSMALYCNGSAWKTVSRSAPIAAARAWAIFSGTSTGTNSPIAGLNVSNIVRLGTGTYTVNFSGALGTAYAPMITCARQFGTEGFFGAYGQAGGTGLGGTSFTLLTGLHVSGSAVPVDPAHIYLTVFGTAAL